MAAYPFVVDQLINKLRYFFGIIMGVLIASFFNWVGTLAILTGLVFLISLVTLLQHCRCKKLDTPMEELQQLRTLVNETKRMRSDG